MTREQIIERIAELSHNGTKGLTREEFIEVGIMHRQLPVTLKSWQWLAEVTGYCGTSEAYRSMVVRALDRNGQLQHAIDLNNEASIVNERQELFKVRQQVRDERTNLNKSLREEARLETFKELIKDIASTYHKLPECTFKGTKSVLDSKGEAVFGLADLHLGLEFKNVYNEYNYEIAKRRIAQLATEIINYCKLFKIDTLHVLNLGDLISGIIHPTLRLDQEFDVIEQVMRASEIVAEFVNKLQEACPHITYRSVVDNHSRNMPDKHQSLESENMNRIIDWFVQERLKDTKVVFADDNLDIGIGRVKLMNGKTLIFMHGHEDKKTSVVHDMSGLTREVPNYILMAHFHNTATHTFQDTKVFITGSIIGTDPYAFGKRLFGRPEQKLLVFDGDNVLDINISLE